MTRLKNVNGRPVYEYKLSEAEEIETTTTTTTMTRKIKLNLFEQDKIQHTKHHPIYWWSSLKNEKKTFENLKIEMKNKI